MLCEPPHKLRTRDQGGAARLAQAELPRILYSDLLRRIAEPQSADGNEPAGSRAVGVPWSEWITMIAGALLARRSS